jgi:hypothetical protein
MMGKAQRAGIRVLVAAAVAAAPVITAGMAAAQPVMPGVAQTSAVTLRATDDPWLWQHCRINHETWQSRCRDYDHQWRDHDHDRPWQQQQQPQWQQPQWNPWNPQG